MKLSTIVTAIIAIIGAFALSVVTQIFQPSEKVNALWLVVAAACFFIISYRLYGSFITAKVLALDDRRLTPSKRMADGRDYHPTHKWVLFGHHFAAIAGAGPLIGPVLAAQFGYLPGFLWILIGAALGGAVSLAVGMASIFSSLPGMKGLMPYWYNFALMFEALFILTTKLLWLFIDKAAKAVTPAEAFAFKLDAALVAAMAILAIVVVIDSLAKWYGYIYGKREVVTSEVVEWATDMEVW